jgi:predicted AAA+ superfamily ATPase
MLEYKRHQFGIIEPRLKEKRKFIQVISGPRQTGKTTLIRQLLANSGISNTYISADSLDSSGKNWMEKHWEAARIVSSQKKADHILAIDEIQKIPEWSNIVKDLWDEDTFLGNPVKVVLSGSSNLLLQQGLADSLTGRFELTRLNHWSMTEMSDAFGWSPVQYAWFGGYPGSADLIRDEQRWKKYVRDALVEPTISKDILMMTRIDKPVLLRQFFDLGCNYSGQILSYNKMLGQLQDAGNTVTLANYLNLLDKAGLMTGLEKFSGSLSRQKLSSPKLSVRNTALLSSSRPESMKEIMLKPEIWGRIVESSVGAHLINSSENSECKLWYWRDGNDEVDYIVQKGRKLAAIEMKTGAHTRKTGFDRFKKLYPESRIILVGDGGIPWQEFLKTDPEELL